MSAKPLDELRRRLGNGPAPGAFAALAEEHRRSGRFEEAVTVCREGLARYPTYVSARVTLGRALLDMGDTTAAIDELEQAVSQAPDNLAATKALEAARDAAADAPGEAVADLDAPDTHAASPVDAGDDQAPVPSSLDWLTADTGEVPWQLGSAPDRADVEPAALGADHHETARDAAPEPEALVAAGQAPWTATVQEPTAWDETIYAPVMPVPLEIAAPDAEELSAPAGLPHTPPDAIVDPVPPVDAPASASVVWLSDEVIAFPAFQADEPAVPLGEGPDEAASAPGAGKLLETTELDDAWPSAVDTPAPGSQLDALLDGDDPIHTWAGFADVPAHSDAHSWGETVDAAMGEVFAQVAPTGVGADTDADADADLAAGWATPPPDEAPAAAPFLAASGEATGTPGPAEEATPALRTLETLLLAIRERRAALALGRPDVD